MSEILSKFEIVLKCKMSFFPVTNLDFIIFCEAHCKLKQFRFYFRLDFYLDFLIICVCEKNQIVQK